MEHECPSGRRHCWNVMAITVGTHKRCCYCQQPNPHLVKNLNEGPLEDDLDQS